MAEEKSVIYTIGCSNHDFNHFRDLLFENGITLVVDVRSITYSGYLELLISI